MLKDTKYLKMYASLKMDIENETYPKDSYLPSEKDLMKIYKVSRDTVRKALALLENEGYIHKIKGRGSVVLERDLFDFSINTLTSFKEVAEQSAMEVTTKVYELSSIPCPQDIASKMNLVEGEEVWKLVRSRIINGEAIILDIDYIWKKYVPELTVEIAEDSLYAYFEEKLGLQIAFAQKVIQIVKANEEDAKCLDMGTYDMVATVSATVHLQEGEIFQYTESRHRPDRFVFTDFARRNPVLMHR